MQARCTKGLSTLAHTVTDWQSRHGRHDLPWQGTTDAYRIWLSEIMLQQTQVTTVIPYYQRFLQRFPDVANLAHADIDEVMPYWAGLGYYARARNLHRCARVILEKYGGHFPADSTTLAELPGIGRSTAAAIAAFSAGERSPIMDGNVKRVFTRYFGIYGDPTRRAVENALWELAETAIERAGENLDMRRYTQGLMDMGATVCTRHRPSCVLCPLQENCYARRHDAQADLPQRRPRKTLPERECQMLVVLHDNKVLLQQQPATGIWGGLWILPMVDDPEQHDATLNDLGVRADQTLDLPPLTHTFSHFRLHIRPVQIIVKNRPQPRIADATPPREWVELTALADAALPAPVKTILLKGPAAAFQVCAGR